MNISIIAALVQAIFAAIGLFAVLDWMLKHSTAKAKAATFLPAADRERKPL